MASIETQFADAEIKDQEEVRTYENGFTWKTFFGALFIAAFMLPGGIYLGLVAGAGVGDAAAWVTIVLFAEVARRSFQPLRKQEIYILYYVAVSLAMTVNAGLGLGGGPFANMIWNAYFVSSPSAQTLVHGAGGGIPHWAIPDPSSAAILQRQLWHPDWLVPIGLLVVGDLLGRIAWMGMGYTLFRVTNDIEKLPFPMAPVAASGATALSEAGSESWRWSIFSTGTVIGLIFGGLYVGLPVMTNVLFGTATTILPIPFADYTTNVENILPAAIVGVSFSLGNVLFGFVVPFEIVLGSAIASVLGMIILNPILHHFGMLPSYQYGMGAIATRLAVDFDFWLSIGIGINISVAIIGIYLVLKAYRDAKKHMSERKYALAPPKGRGDIPIFLALGLWLFSVVALITICHVLVPQFPVWILVFFGLIWSPINSYVSARMIGMTGQGISFPYLKEASVVASGYKRVDIWYAPIPMADHGWAAQRFREVELTGTKFTSVFKAEVLMFCIVMPASFAFWSFFWNSNAVPSAQFPFAQKMWPNAAAIGAVMQQINVTDTENWFKQAIRPAFIGYGTASGLLVYVVFTLFKWPMLCYYGFIGGLGLYPANTLPTLLGAWLGKRFFSKKYGVENWRKFAPVLLAGFACGTGLISMVSISLALISKAVAKLPY